MVPKLCYLCDQVLEGSHVSNEHVIPNSIGGWFESSDLLCRTCNSKSGYSIDAAFTKPFTAIANLLGIRRSRGRVPSIPVTLAGGRRANRFADGRIEVVRPHVEVRALADGTRQLLATARSARDLRPALVHLARTEPKLDVNAALQGAATRSEYVTLETGIQLRGVGGPELFRGLAKTAVSFYLMRGGRGEHASGAIAYLRREPNEDDRIGYWHHATDPVLNRPADFAGHIIAIHGDPASRRLAAYVEIFRAFRGVVCLSDDYTGEAYFEYAALDPVSGREVPTVSVLPRATEWVPDDVIGVERFREEMAHLSVAISTLDRKRTIGRIVDRAFANAFALHAEPTRGDLLPLLWRELEPWLLTQIVPSRCSPDEI